MTRIRLLDFLALAALLLALSAGAWAHEATPAKAPSAPARSAPAAPVVPPLPPGVAELKFKDFYKMPVGPYGLEPTEKLLALQSKRVRILGYMVAEGAPTPGLFILSPFPMALADVDDGPADDLPPSIVFVHMPGEDAKRVVPRQRAPLLLTGTLDLGGKEEASGRVSYVRLMLDPPSAATRKAAARAEAAKRKSPQQ